jgi:phospholipase D1/2
MVFLPLMPGFSGDVTDSIASLLRIQMAYEFETISKGEFSLIELLKKDGIPDPFKYIKFYSLRNHDLMKSGIPI